MFLEALDTARQGSVPEAGIASEPDFTAETAIKLRALLSPKILLSDSQLVDHRGIHDLLRDPKRGPGFREFLAKRTVLGLRSDADSLRELMEYHLSRVKSRLVFSGMSSGLNGNLAQKAKDRARSEPLGIKDLQNSDEGAAYVNSVEALDDIFGETGQIVKLRSGTLDRWLRRSQVRFLDGNLEEYRNRLADESSSASTRTTCYAAINDWALRDKIQDDDAVCLKEYVDDAYNRSFWDQEDLDITPVLSPRAPLPDTARGAEPLRWPAREAFVEVPAQERSLPSISKMEITFDDLANFEPTGVPAHVLRASSVEDARDGWVAYVSRSIDEFLKVRRARRARTTRVIVQVGGAVGAADESYNVARSFAHLPAISIAAAAAGSAVAAYGLGWFSSWWEGRADRRITAAASSALFQSELVRRPVA